MKISFETLELIKRYAKGELNGEELTTFEQMLVDRPELQEEVNLAKMLVGETEKVERERILEVIKQANLSPSEESPNDTPTKNATIKNFKTWLAVAASILLLMVSIWLWKMQQPDLEEQLFAFQKENYISPSDDFVRGTNSTTNLDNAFREYQEKNYTESLNWLNTISNEDTLYLRALNLKGHNYYLSNEYEKGMKIFDEILSNEAAVEKYVSPNFDQVGWTQILIILSQFNLNPSEDQKTAVKKAVTDFLKTANPTDIYYQNAVELNKILE